MRRRQLAAALLCGAVACGPVTACSAKPDYNSARRYYVCFKVAVTNPEEMHQFEQLLRKYAPTNNAPIYVGLKADAAVTVYLPAGENPEKWIVALPAELSHAPVVKSITPDPVNCAENRA